MIDYISRNTYFYAGILACCLLLDLNVTAHSTYGTVTEEVHPWPALPPLVNGIQFGPPFVLPLPAGPTVLTRSC